MKDLLAHYVPLQDSEEREIWRKQKTLQADAINVPDDELVEDAGLLDEMPSLTAPEAAFQTSFV
jgi:hypothetical protein